MTNNTQYLTFRYSIIKESQMHMYSKALPSIKGQIIYHAFVDDDGDREFKRFGVNYSFIGFHYVEPKVLNGFESNRYLIGKLAKLKHTETGVRVPGDIMSIQQDDWVGSVVVVDTHTQHIFVQKNWKLGNTEQIENALNAGVAKAILEEFNCKVFIKAKTDESKFWEIIEESKSIYNLTLKMVSPNILETNLKAREALKNLQAVFKQDEFDFTLRNDIGRLEVPVNPISDYVDYISEGEGSWKVTRVGRQGGKKTLSSLDNIKIAEVPESHYPEVDIKIPKDHSLSDELKNEQEERINSLIDFFNQICVELNE